jgi:DNA repair exonuclease SbcCD nuclease subunit
MQIDWHIGRLQALVDLYPEFQKDLDAIIKKVAK